MALVSEQSQAKDADSFGLAMAFAGTVQQVKICSRGGYGQGRSTYAIQVLPAALNHINTCNFIYFLVHAPVDDPFGGGQMKQPQQLVDQAI